jgi:hypothetical protein
LIAGAVALLLAAAAVLAAGRPQPLDKGTMIMEYAKREIPDPEPVSLKGIRYEAAEGKAHGFAQNGGTIAAVEEASGRTLWTLKVYDAAIDPDEEEDVQEVYITRLTPGPDGERLLVEVEDGRRFTISLTGRAVSQAN